MITSGWCYTLEQPHLTAYPTQAESPESLPDLDEALRSIGEYQRRLRANRNKAVLLLVHGLDASGKDSLIRTLATFMDPAGFKAWSFGRPEGVEARHDFLWRFVPLLPAFGEVVAFNRSYHEGVIAERVWPVRVPESYDWTQRYKAVRDFEKNLVNEGTTVIKCWLNVSQQEHRKRLLKRLERPHKQWKFDHADLDAWDRRAELLRYTEEALAATHTPQAPWLIIPGDSKAMARRITAAVVADVLRSLAPDYPDVDKSLLATYRQRLGEDV
jgi:polyphosphate kinase 2 (PPK2 family)